MYLVAIAWIYVVLMMAVAEGTSASGTVLGALVTFMLYGVFPLSIVMYLLRTPARKRARRAAEAAADGNESGAGLPPDAGDHPPSDAIAAVGKEP